MEHELAVIIVVILPSQADGCPVVAAHCEKQT